MATKSSSKSKSALKGTSAADVLTVKHDQVTVTAAGGNDTIKITKGNSSKVSGDAGKDTITVSAGKSHTIHGNAANDTITIGKSAGTGIKAYGDAGNDTIKATNSYAVTFYGGDGSDTLTGGKGGDKLYGQAGADKLYGGAGNDTLSGGAGDDKLYGQAGTDTLTGGAGKDTFVYASGGGSDKITDYAAGYDTLQISSGSISKTALANSSKDLVFTVGTGKVTLSNAAAKTVSLKDSRGSYTASKTAITLGSNFTGTMDTAKYLGTVTTVNGKSTTKTVTIKGNAKANTIYGGSAANTIYGYAGNDKLYGYGGNDTLSGGDGDDTLYGGAGTDTLTGGAGKDTFVYANGDGSDTVKDYTEGSDTLYISSGSISATALANSDNDLVITVGSGKVTLAGAAAKEISLKDSRGSYTVSNTAITLGSDFTGTMDATKYLSTVTTIDGSAAAAGITIKDNALDNTIYGGIGNDTVYISSGRDTVNAGAGENIFRFTGSGWEAAIMGTTGSDRLDFSQYADGYYDFGQAYRSGDDFILTYEHNFPATDDQPWQEPELTGTLRLKDYFTATDRMSAMTCYHYDSGTTVSMNLLAGDNDDTAVEGTSGNDLIITGNGYKTVNAGDGNDVIDVGWGECERKIGDDVTEFIPEAMATGKQVINAGNGNDRIWVGYFTDGMGHTLNGGAGDDWIYVLAGGEGAQNNSILNGEEGNDRLDACGSWHRLNGGSGEDQIYIGGYENTVHGGEDDDIISNYYGDGNTLYGDGGDDSIDSGYGEGNKVYGGDGDDSIYISGTDFLADGGAGNDLFSVEESFGGVLRGGAGLDRYIIPIENENCSITIDQAGDPAGDADSLELAGAYRDDIAFSYADGELTITHCNGGTITVTNWDTNPLSEIYFSDGDTITGGDINASLPAEPPANVITVNAEETYTGTEAKDVFTAEGYYWYADITGTGNNDVLDVSYYDFYTISREGRGVVVDLHKEINDGGSIYTESAQVTLTDEDIHIGLATGNGDFRLVAGTGTEVNGTGDNDIVVAGSGQTIDAKAGDDTVYISGGCSDSTVLCGDGDDWCNVEDGSENTAINGGNGNDSIDFYGFGSGNAIYGGEGNDRIGIQGVYSGSLSGGYGSDTYSVDWYWDEGICIQIDQAGHDAGDRDELIVTWTGKDDVAFSRDEGDLIVTRSDGNEIRITGWDENPLAEIIFGDETVTADEINGILESQVPEVIELIGTDGDDELSAKGNYYIVNGLAGNDTIVLNGRDGQVFGGEGNDIITVNGRRNLVFGDEGDDTIQVAGGDGHQVFGGDGDDTFIIDSAGGDVLMFGGNGSDTYIINTLSDGGFYFIDPSAEIYEYPDVADTLQLTGISTDDVWFELDQGYLNISHNDGGLVQIANWEDTPLSQVVFADGALTGSEISNLL